MDLDENLLRLSIDEVEVMELEGNPENSSSVDLGVEALSSGAAVGNSSGSMSLEVPVAQERSNRVSLAEKKDPQGRPWRELYASKSEAVRERKKLKAARKRQEVYQNLSKAAERGLAAKSTTMVTKRLVSQRNEWSGVTRDTVSYSSSGDLADQTSSSTNALPAGYWSDDGSGHESGEEDEEKPHWMRKKLVPNPFCQGLVPRPPVLADSDQPMLNLRVDDWYFYGHAKSELRFFSVSDRWAMLEREQLLYDVRNSFPRQVMPSTSIQTMYDDAALTCRYEGSHKQRYAEFIDRSPGRDPVLEQLIANVMETRILIINTEGKNRKRDGRPWVLLSIGSMSGHVAFFSDLARVPKHIKDLLSDPAYTKLGSGLINEHQEMKRAGLRIRNWVDSGAMRLILYREIWTNRLTPKGKVPEKGQVPHGIESQIMDLQMAYWFVNYERTPYNFRWEWDKEYQKFGRPPRSMLPHLIENIRVPAAHSILLVYAFAKLRGYDLSTEPFYPVLHEAFDVCRGRDPFIQQKSLDPPQKEVDYWSARPSQLEREHEHNLPANCKDVDHFRRAQADFVEPYLKGDPVAIAKFVFQRFFGHDGIEFPTAQEMEESDMHSIRQLRCKGCAKIGHDLGACPLVKDPVCRYPHDGEEFEPHTTLCCPNLHAYCKICLKIGHHSNVHWKEGFLLTSRELRRRFFEFMDQGAFTSMLFLVFHPEGRFKLTSSHWRMSYDSRRFNTALVTRYVLGIDKIHARSEAEEVMRSLQYTQWKEGRDQLLALIRQNVEAEEDQWIAIPINFTVKIISEAAAQMRQARKTDKARQHQSFQQSVQDAKKNKRQLAAAEKQRSALSHSRKTRRDEILNRNRSLEKNTSEKDEEDPSLKPPGQRLRGSGLLD